MKIKLIPILLLLLLTACNKQLKEKCEGKTFMYYEFDFPVSISPATDTIAFGDTLWVEIKIDNPILNKLNNKSYDVANANFYMFFNIGDLMLVNMVDRGNYITLDENGNYAPNTNPDGDVGTKVTFKSDGNGHLVWKRGYVINARGIYLLQFHNSLSYRSTRPYITECPKESVSINHSFNGETSAESKNYYLLQYSLDANVRSWTNEQIAGSTAYAICVD